MRKSSNRAALLSLIFLCELPVLARAESATDIVVVPHGTTTQVDELMEAVVRVTEAELQKRGVSQPIRAAEVFERVHSRVPSGGDDERQLIAKQLAAAMDARQTVQIADLSMALLDRVREVPTDPRSTDTSVVWACERGSIALAKLGRHDEERRVIEACASFVWLVTEASSVPPDVRDRVLRDVREFELTVTTTAANDYVWLQGYKATVGKAFRLRSLPGARIAIRAECGVGSRDHWVVAEEGARLRVHIDCDFDAAVHTDSRGLWLSSPHALASAHAREVARVLGARELVLVSRTDARYNLRLVSGDGTERVVGLPLIHSDEDMAAAIDKLLLVESPGRHKSIAAGQAVTAQRSHWAMWTGVALIVAGAGLEAAAWVVDTRRAARAGRLTDVVSFSQAAQDSWLDLRPPMLGLAGAGSVAAVAGAGLLVGTLPDEALPWWSAAAVGVVGVGLAAGGGVEIAKGRRCRGDDLRDCAPEEATRDRGALLLATGAPLLVVPVAKLLGLTWTNRARGKADVAIGVASQSLVMSGRW